jgi:anti-sigma regulatory factor (Ser/Thr protein kinase)
VKLLSGPVPNTLPALVQWLRNWFESFVERHCFQQTQLEDVLLVLEELLSNIVRHVYSNSPEHVATVCVTHEGGRALLCLKYGGPAFDPWSADEDDELGLMLIRKLAQPLSIRAEHGNNQLDLSMPLEPDTYPEEASR